MDQTTLEIKQALMRERIKNRPWKPRKQRDHPWSRLERAERRLYAYKCWIRGWSPGEITRRLNAKYDMKLTVETVENVIAGGFKLEPDPVDLEREYDILLPSGSDMGTPAE
jgi:hypothetical protein